MPDFDAAKHLAYSFWTALTGDVDPEAPWHVSHPLNTIAGRDLEERLWGPLFTGLDGIAAELHLLFAGTWRDRSFVTVAGLLHGDFTRAWLGIPATEGPAALRFGAFHDVTDGTIGETRLLFDIVDFAHRAGVDLLPVGRYDHSSVTGPTTGDGVATAYQGSGAEALALVESMAFDGLLRYDGRSLESMGMERFWDVGGMRWYGPGGIGTTLGLVGFQKHHQIPFLRAIPDRGGIEHYARFGEAGYVASGGWPSLKGTWQGDYLGFEADGRPITMRVMDWWRVENGRLVENWVLVDLLEFLVQIGRDRFPGGTLTLEGNR